MAKNSWAGRLSINVSPLAKKLVWIPLPILVLGLVLTRPQLSPQTLAARIELSKMQTLTAAHPNFRDAWVHAGYDYYLLGQKVDAKKAVQTALELDPNYQPALKLQALLP